MNDNHLFHLMKSLNLTHSQAASLPADISAIATWPTDPPPDDPPPAGVAALPPPPIVPPSIVRCAA